MKTHERVFVKAPVARVSHSVQSLEELEPRLLPSHTLVIGHRGSNASAPENTLISLRQALDAGADVVEADIHITADGVPVLMHDDTVDRTTDGTGPVSSFTLAQLKTLDAGSWMGAQYAGERVPTLAEALEATRGRGIVYLDLKVHRSGAAIRQVLDEVGLPDRSVWVALRDEADVRDIHQYLPGTPVLWWGDIPRRGTAEYFQSMRVMGVTGFDLNWWRFPHAFIKVAQANGMFFSTYTLNSDKTLRAALKLDLDAIETDDPARLVALIDGPKDQIRADLVDGTLVIQGDKFDNRIRIEPGATAGTVRLRGVRGTLVNEQSSPQEFSGVRKISVALDSGHDWVEMVDVLLDEGLTFDTGRGNDEVSMVRCRFGDLVRGGMSDGLDRFEASNSSFNSLVLDGGSGMDTVDAGLRKTPDNSGNLFATAPTIVNSEIWIS